MIKVHHKTVCQYDPNDALSVSHCFFISSVTASEGFSGGSVVKNPLANAVRSLGLQEPLEEEMATCSSILAWEIPWTEEPGGL